MILYLVRDGCVTRNKAISQISRNCVVMYQEYTHTCHTSVRKLQFFHNPDQIHHDADLLYAVPRDIQRCEQMGRLCNLGHKSAADDPGCWETWSIDSPIPHRRLLLQGKSSRHPHSVSQLFNMSVKCKHGTPCLSMISQAVQVHLQSWHRVWRYFACLCNWMVY